MASPDYFAGAIPPRFSGLAAGGFSGRRFSSVMPPPMIGAPDPVQSQAPISPAMPTGTNLSSYFAPEVGDALTGSGVQGQPFQMGPGTAWPFGASWQAILQG